MNIYNLTKNRIYLLFRLEPITSIKKLLKDNKISYSSINKIIHEFEREGIIWIGKGKYNSFSLNLTQKGNRVIMTLNQLKKELE